MFLNQYFNLLLYNELILIYYDLRSQIIIQNFHFIKSNSKFYS